MAAFGKPYIGQIQDLFEDYKRDCEQFQDKISFAQYAQARMLADALYGIHLKLNEIAKSIDEIAANSNK